jgi:integrase
MEPRGSGTPDRVVEPDQEWNAERRPLNRDGVAVLEEQLGKHERYCFTYRGKPIRWEVTNSAWKTALEKAGIEDFRFHDLRHTWASWHRQAGTSCDELKDLGGWKSRVMVDRYAKYATEHLAAAASRIEGGRGGEVTYLPTNSLRSDQRKVS